MKNLKVTEEFKKIAKEKPMKLVAVGVCIALMAGTLAGCAIETAVTQDATAIYDTIYSEGENVEIAPQEIDVPGEDFKLVVEYSLDSDTQKEWRITADKKLYTKVYTKGLPEGTKVYIDNVHTDCNIVSSHEILNGIPQDSMDDRIHNSLMYGFPISDTTCFYAINEIEGQNDDFIQGFTMGYNGYSTGQIEEKRHDEEFYLKNGVYGNKISSAYGLLISKDGEEPYGVDVSSDVVIVASNTITTKDQHGVIRVYKYNRDGEYKVVSETPEEKTTQKTK